MARPQRAPQTAGPVFSRQRAPIHSSKNAAHQAAFRERMKLGKENASLAQKLDAARQQVTDALKARQTDAAIELYRAERAKRGDQLAPLMSEARREFDRLLEAAKTSQRGGRPKKYTPKPQSWEIEL